MKPYNRTSASKGKILSVTQVPQSVGVNGGKINYLSDHFSNLGTKKGVI